MIKWIKRLLGRKPKADMPVTTLPVVYERVIRNEHEAHEALYASYERSLAERLARDKAWQEYHASLAAVPPSQSFRHNAVQAREVQVAASKSQAKRIAAQMKKDDDGNDVLPSVLTGIVVSEIFSHGPAPYEAPSAPSIPTDSSSSSFDSGFSSGGGGDFSGGGGGDSW